MHTDHDAADEDDEAETPERCGRPEVDGGDGDTREADDEASARTDTGNLFEDADGIAERLRRARRSIQGRHLHRLGRDLDRVRAGMGLDAGADGDGGSGGDGSSVGRRTIRDLERELLLAETKAKMGIEAPPVRVDNYEILRRLGGGGMGVVWLAVNPMIDHKVALKVMRRSGDRGPTLAIASQAAVEGQALATLRHDNVVRIHGSGDLGGQPYLVMEYLDGRTLTRWCRECEPREAEILAVYAQIARGLEAVHCAGFVHGDVKPDNVILTADGVPKIVDFGMVIRPGAGFVGGTPEYMALEQLDPEAPRIAYASDQYALCVALYEELVGAHPYVGQSYDQFAETVRRSDPKVAPDAVRQAYITRISDNLRQGHLHRTERLRRLPGWLRRALERGLNPSAELRFRSMAALADALERPRRMAAMRRRLGLGGLAALAGAAVVAGVIVMNQVDPCGAVEGEIDEVWSAVKDEPPSQAAALLDPYVDTWKKTRREVCEATFERREVSGATHEARAACLSSRVEDVRAVVSAIKGGAKVTSLGGSLRPPGFCAALLRPELEVPRDPEVERKVAEVAGALKDVFADEIAERYEEGIDRANDAVQAAIATGHEPIIAASLYQRARIALAAAVNAGDPDGTRRPLGERSLADALAHAGRANESIWFDAKVLRSRFDGVSGDVPAEGEDLLEVGLPLHRLDDAGRAAIDDAAALVAYRRAQRMDAKSEARAQALRGVIRRYEGALDVYQQSRDRFAEAKALENLGDAYSLASDPDAALERYRAAMSIWENTFGADAGYLGSLYAREITALSEGGNTDAAIQRCTEAQRWIAAMPEAEGRVINAARIDLACAGANYGTPARAMEFALKVLEGPLRSDEEASGMELASLLRLDLVSARDVPMATAEPLLERADKLLEARWVKNQALRPPPEMEHLYRGRLHLRRQEFSAAADRFASARALTQEPTPELLVDLIEAHKGAGLPLEAPLLTEARAQLDAAIKANPDDPNLKDLRARLELLLAPTPP